MYINPGEFKHRVKFEESSQTRDGTGQPVKTWSEIKTYWAKVVENKGSEGFQDAKKSATKVIEVWIRFKETINEQSRLTYRSELYDIISVTQVHFKKYLKIYAERLGGNEQG